MSEILKPCPFCGGEAKQHLGVFSWVECKNCGNKTRQYQFDNQSIDAWNRRPEPRQLTLDELRQMDGQPVWIHWPNGPEKDRWIIWNKPWRGTMFDLDDPAVRYGEMFIAFDRPPGGDVHEG